jgi:tRNA-specific 2-thiouridylase
VPTGPVEGQVQLRAHGEPLDAVVEVVAGGADDGGDLVVAALRRPARGVAPGQALVVYDGTRVVGSSTIVRATSATSATRA